PLNSGGRYNPLTDEWLPTSTLNAPLLRANHTAVWTGTQIVAWGGNIYTAYTNEGGRYDPVADTWSPTSLLNAPSPRSFHTAVWTGDSMVIWGGADGTLSRTGGRYEPVTD